MDRKSQLNIEFNIDKKGTPDEGFTVTLDPYPSNLNGERWYTYTFHIKSLDLDYEGEYYVKVFYHTHKAVWLFQGKPSETLKYGLGEAKSYKLYLNDDNSLNLYRVLWEPVALISADVVIYDEYGNKCSLTIKHNS